jgi:WD40 repeat protein
VWDTSDFALMSSSRGAMGGYFAFEVLPDGDTMVAVDITGTISIVDMATGETVSALAGSTFRSTTLALSPDASIVAAPTADAGIAFWSIQSGELLATTYGHTANVTGLAFAPDASWIASSSQDGTVRTWSVESFR